jgi:hypothetical protein
MESRFESGRGHQHETDWQCFEHGGVTLPHGASKHLQEFVHLPRNVTSALLSVPTPSVSVTLKTNRNAALAVRKIRS